MNATQCLSKEFRPLDREEMHSTQGGIFGAIAIGLAIAAGAEIIGDWDNFKAGLMGLPEIQE